MSYEAKTEYITLQKRRYKPAEKPYKTRLLNNDVCERALHPNKSFLNQKTQKRSGTRWMEEGLLMV